MTAGGPAVLAGPGDVTASWCTDVLARSGALAPGARVAAVTSEPIGTGQMAETVRLHLAVDPAGAGPATVVAKFASTDATSRSTGVALDAYRIEVGIYRDVAGRLAGRVPRCHFAAGGEGEGWFTVVLDEVVGASQGEQLEGCDATRAAGALAELAGVHASTWESRSLGALPWLARWGPDSARTTAQLVAPLYPGFLERYGDRLQPEHRDLGRRFVARLEAWLGGRTGGHAVTHGDFRLDNLLFAGDDPRPWVVDWQTALWAPAVGDVAYFVGGSLTTEVRRAAESDLVGGYRAALEAGGVAGGGGPGFDDDYRRAAFGGMFMAIGASMLVKRTERGDTMFTTNFTRHAQHVLDLDAEAALPGGAR